MSHKIARACFATLLALSLQANATEFRIVGARALGMGGAGVAGARGAAAIYYNPAALAAPSVGAASRVSLGIGAGLHDFKLAESLDRLANYDWAAITGNPEAHEEDAAAIREELLKMDESSAVFANADGGVLFQIGRFGAGLGSSARLAVSPDVDTQHLAITDPDDPNSLFYNTSAAILKGIILTEIPLAYGHPFALSPNTTLDVGVTLRLIHSATYDKNLLVTEATSDDLTDELDNAFKESNTFGMDLGLLCHTPAPGLSIGLVARNLNSPSFDTVEGRTIEESLQVRGGAEWAFFNRRLCFAADCDLTENETLFDGYKSRMLGGGVEIATTPSIFLFALRLGMMKNLAETDPGLVYTGGVSLGFKYFHLSASGAMSSQESTVDGDNYPSEARLVAALESTW